MTGPSKHELGQLGHLDLLALAFEAEAAPSDDLLLRLGSRSKEQLVDALTRTGPLVRLADRADMRLKPVSAPERPHEIMDAEG
jgi:hypothetical protein